MLTDLIDAYFKDGAEGVGTHKWTATVQAKTLGTEGTTLRVLDVLKVPTEHGRALVKSQQSSGGAISMRDNFGATSGALTGDTSTSGHTWASMGGLTDADDFTETASPDNAVIRTAVGDGSGGGDPRYGRGVTLGTATPTGVSVSVTAVASVDNISSIGVIARATDNDNFVIFLMGAGAAGGVPPAGMVNYTIYALVAGSRTNLASGSVPGNMAIASTYTLEISASGGWTASLDGVSIANGVSTLLATGGALASGKSGTFDWQTNNTANTRTYSDFRVTIPTPEEAAIHPGRRLQWSDDGGLHREALAGTDFSYAQGQQGVGVPLIGPEGAETLTNRLVIASDGQNPDYAATGARLPRLDWIAYARPAYAIGRHTN